MRGLIIQISGLVLALAASLCAYAAAPVLPAYSLTLIPEPPHASQLVPTAINSSGQVTGSILWFPGQPAHAFIYSDGVLTDIGTLVYPGSNIIGGASGLSINDAGIVVGTVADPFALSWSFGFVYENGKMTGLQGATGFPNCTATAINDLQLIVGGCSSLASSFAAIYTNNTPQPIGSAGGLATAVNAYGQVVVAGTTSGFVYDNGVVTTIPAISGSSPMQVPKPLAINNAGQVVGTQAVTSGYLVFLYSSGATNALAGLAASPDHPFANINNAGQVVGYQFVSGTAPAQPFLSTKGTLTNVNALISPTDPLQRYVTIISAIAINDSGLIVATGVDSRTQATGAYLLSPVTPWPLDVSVETNTGSGAETGTPFTVAWTDQSADTCMASGGSGSDGWGGSLATHGGQQQVTETAAGTYVFKVTCADAAGSVSSTATVMVVAKTTPGLQSGGGSLDVLMLGALLLLCGAAAARGTLEMT